MTTSRYTAAAIVLHWAIAVAIIFNILVGWWMHEAIEATETQARAAAAYQVHKSVGLTVLVLSLLRLGLRFFYSVPPLPADMPRWQQWSARATHWLFYALMIGLPLSGWLMVSAQWRHGAPLQVPTLWFGLFEVPHLFGLNEADQGTRAGVHGAAYEAHEILATTTLVLLGLHVAAALKHQFIDRDAVLARMLPVLEPAGSATRRLGLAAGFALLLLAAGAVGYQLLFSSTRVSGDNAVAEISSVPGSWPVQPDDSEIVFSGSHAGKAFRGRFTRWQSDVRINPEAVADSRIVVTVYTASATDGVTLHDETLPGAEWFDVEQYPTAVYRSDEIRSAGDGLYRVDGTLEIKGRAIPIPGLMMDLSGGIAIISGTATVDRADADLGMESDPRGQWVSREIEVEARGSFRSPR